MYVLSDSRVHVKLPSGQFNPASVIDHWSNWQSGALDALKLELVGLSSVKVIFSEGSSGVFFHLAFSSEVGDVEAPNNFESKWDHFIVNNLLVPVRRNEVEPLYELFGSLGVLPYEPISIAKLFRLLVGLREIAIEFEVPNNFENLTKLEPAAAELSYFVGTPYPYQTVGINWLTDYFDNGLGALLCDEMGLGKTFQAIGLVSHSLARASNKVLIVAPASLIANWQKELSQFLPQVAFDVHAGPLRATRPSQLPNQVILTTYETLLRDRTLFYGLPLDLLVADEAQAVKNPESARHRVIKSLDCPRKVLLTGTPVENSLRDLSALIDIVHPGLLGTHEDFVELLEDTPSEAKEIGRIASPMILRRLVGDVAQDLPDLVLIDTPLLPTEAFAGVYEQMRTSPDSPANSSFLGRLTKLSQVCCSPSLVEKDYVDHEDTKLIRLIELLIEIHHIGRDKVIVFTTFQGSIDLLVALVTRKFGSNTASFIDGRVDPKTRQEIIDWFNEKNGFHVLVVNPKAGGTGLNITGANHVIHFNRQWNPAVEAQANARAFRRKQEKTVFVHRFYYLGTVEEIMHKRLFEKQELANIALEDSELSFDKETQMKFLQISPIVRG
jgi:SNF2 family DNA or RNA helicase